MSALQIAGFTVCAAAIALVMRRLRPESATVLVIGAGLLLALAALPQLGEIVRGVAAMAGTGGVQAGCMTQLLKVGGISLLMEFAAQTCRDANEDGLALKVEFVGRVLLIALALPVMRTLLTQIMSLSP